MNIKISTIISKGERVTLECKKAQRSVPYSLWDTYSAFANTYGGTILLGVVEHMEEQDKSKRFEIVGVEDADKIAEALGYDCAEDLDAELADNNNENEDEDEDESVAE